MQSMNWIETIKWDANGLVPAIAQERGSGDVLMFAWMNREALEQTAALGRAVYFSRSRGKLWFKGEESGHVQTVHSIRMDCDSDVLLLEVTQTGHAPGIACHTGRHSCFFSKLEAVAQPASAQTLSPSAAPHTLANIVKSAETPSKTTHFEWKITHPVLKDPQTIYK
jgi:phosphoribosyl-AMP cyclohydrolase